MYERTYKTKVLSQKAEHEKKRRKRFPWKRTLKICAALLALLLAILLVRMPQLQVREIKVVGAEVADPQEIASFIRSQIEGRVLSFLPRSSMLLVPTATLARRTARAYPRFESVDVRRSGLRDLLVTVKEYEGAYLWCSSATNCYFMASSGVVFAKAPFFSGDAYVKFFGGGEGQLPFSPISRDDLDRFRLLIERLPSISIDPLEFHAASEHQLNIVFTHHGGRAELYLDPTADIEKTLEDLATGLAAEPLRGRFRDEREVLRYLDARFANKVIYKFK